MKCVSWFVGIGNHISVFCFVWKRGWAGHSTSVLGVRSFVPFLFYGYCWSGLQTNLLGFV